MAKTSERLDEIEQRIKRLEKALTFQAITALLAPIFPSEYNPAKRSMQEIKDEVEAKLFGAVKEAESDA